MLATFLLIRVWICIESSSVLLLLILLIVKSKWCFLCHELVLFIQLLWCFLWFLPAVVFHTRLKVVIFLLCRGLILTIKVIVWGLTSPCYLRGAVVCCCIWVITLSSAELFFTWASKLRLLLLLLKVPITHTCWLKCARSLLIICSLCIIIFILLITKVAFLPRISWIFLLHSFCVRCEGAEFVLLVGVTLITTKRYLRLVLRGSPLMERLIDIIICRAKWLAHSWLDPIESLSFSDWLPGLCQRKVGLASRIMVQLDRGLSTNTELLIVLCLVASGLRVVPPALSVIVCIIHWLVEGHIHFWLSNSY